MRTNRARIEQRLASYWRLEALNIVVLPGTGLLVIAVADDVPTASTLIAMAAAVSVLLVGTLYWRAVLRALQGDKAHFQNMIKRLDAARYPTALLIALSGLACLLSWSKPAPFTAADLATFTFTVLAVLEYVNYYHIQLQHFDNAADFRRFITGRGFRPAHLATAIKRLQSARR